ncbi:hypothetical protein [Jiella avicenniae]|uniref:Uncharacterized protein n=1 Tax=Jiella avicenniae TaxID=2907202 RepID=A0A9X1T3I4_9HYPH|nr:hypothetical protein [Jiella avicenniae]MCE7027581.1 hypothetical protein [Jiella avicenniae]
MQTNLHDESEEGISAAEFDREEASDEANFGNWPEIVGLVVVAIVAFMILQVTG